MYALLDYCVTCVRVENEPFDPGKLEPDVHTFIVKSEAESPEAEKEERGGKGKEAAGFGRVCSVAVGLTYGAGVTRTGY